MKNFCLIFILLTLCAAKAWSADEHALTELNDAIKHKSTYTHIKQDRINRLKVIAHKVNTPLERLQINKSLCQEFQKFRIDSAVYYCRANLQLAKEINDNTWLINTQIQLADLYSSLGKYLESVEMLNKIPATKLTREQLINYYDAKLQFYEHYSANNDNDTYLKLIDKYRDSLINLIPQNSISYQICLAEKNINSHHFNIALQSLHKILSSGKTDNPGYAMITYLLGRTYERQLKPDSAIYFYALSATTDIKNAIKDNASQQNLALLLYKTGNIDLAFSYTKSAIEDAIFCDVKFRTLGSSAFYAIVNAAYLNKEATRKGQLKLYLACISILSVFLLIAVIYVYKQMRRVSRIKEELDITGKQLVLLNKEISEKNLHLNEINTELSEANKIKEIYIAQFFDLCSNYIVKLEDYRKALNKKVQDKKWDELAKTLRSSRMAENEAEELYKVFDNIFLRLYPTFIHDFNQLILPDEKVTVKPGELLNTELRIYALVKLGITDSVKIASFLRYSLSTIYNYRTAARNKASVPRDDFEQMVMKIGIN